MKKRIRVISVIISALLLGSCNKDDESIIDLSDTTNEEAVNIEDLENISETDVLDRELNLDANFDIFLNRNDIQRQYQNVIFAIRRRYGGGIFLRRGRSTVRNTTANNNRRIYGITLHQGGFGGGLIQFIFDSRNFYLLGAVQRRGTRRFFYRLRGEGQRTFVRNTGEFNLNIDENYTGRNGLESLARRGRGGVGLGFGALGALARNNRFINGGQRERAEMLLQAVIFFSEAVRFDPIFNGINNALRRRQGHRISQEQVIFTNNWGRLTNVLRRLAADGNFRNVDVGSFNRALNATRFNGNLIGTGTLARFAGVLAVLTLNNSPR